MKIGIFDSGIGGITVLNEAYRMLPKHEFLYYADTEHVPYGLKEPEEVRGYSKEIVRFLISEGAEAIVIACNTATSVAAAMLRETFSLPIIGMEPAVKPAVTTLKSHDDTGRVLVLATPVTSNQEKLKNLIAHVDTDHRVDVLPLPGLVAFAEREQFDDDAVRAYLAEAFSGCDPERYGAVVPGCTHFLYFLPLLRSFFREDCMLTDGNAGTVRQLIRRLYGEDGLLQAEREAETAGAETDVFPQTVYFESGHRVTEENMLGKYRRLHDRIRSITAGEAG